MYRLLSLPLVCVLFLGLLWLTSACQELTENQCANSTGCKRQGLCSLDAEKGVCIATSNESCQKSRFCRDNGECTAANNRCVAGSEADCRQSFQCKENGFCLQRNGECIAITKSYCQIQETCKTLGQCSLDRKNYVCQASDARDCEESDICKQEKKCQVENGQCVITDLVCKTGESCKKEGLCSRRINDCIAASDQDCTGSEACKNEGRCIARYSRCINPEAIPEGFELVSEPVSDGGGEPISDGGAGEAGTESTTGIENTGNEASPGEESSSPEAGPEAGPEPGPEAGPEEEPEPPSESSTE